MRSLCMNKHTQFQRLQKKRTQCIRNTFYILSLPVYFKFDTKYKKPNKYALFCV